MIPRTYLQKSIYDSIIILLENEQVDSAIDKICYMNYDKIFLTLPGSPIWDIYGYENLDEQVDEEYSIEKRLLFEVGIMELLKKRKTISNSELTQLEIKVNEKRNHFIYNIANSIL